MKKEYVKPEIITVDVNVAFAQSCACRSLSPRGNANLACTTCGPAVENTYLVT